MSAATASPTVAAVRPKVGSGIALGLVSALAFSSSGPLVKPLLEGGWSLGATLLVRMGVAGLLLSPALLVAMRRERGFVRRHARLVVGFGATGVVGCQLCYFAALQRMPVAIALLIEYLAPVLLVGYTWLRSRRAPSRLVLIGTTIAVVGLVLVVDVAGARFDLLGALYALGAAVCMALYFLISERTGDDLPPLALASGGLLVGGGLMAVLCLAGILPFTAPAIDVPLAGSAVAWFLPVGWIVVVSTALAYAVGVMAVPRMGSRLASFVGLSEVLFALLFAWLLLGEAPAPMQLLGGGLILAGVVLVRLDAGGYVARPESSSSGATR